MENSAKKIQIKPVIDEEEGDYMCLLCQKSFFNVVAIQNHLWVQHMVTEISSSTIQVKIKPEPPESLEPPEIHIEEVEETVEEVSVETKTANLLSSLKPTSLVSLASENVSYLIVKADDVPEAKIKKQKKIVIKKANKVEVQGVTGPFECLQQGIGGTSPCNEKFYNCCEYSIHYRDIHAKKRKPGQCCQVCEKPLLLAFPTGRELPFPCQVCGSSYQSQELLDMHHHAAHVKLKPHVCNVCNKRFKHYSGVQQHMRMHTGDRPFKCTYCPKGFTQKAGLEQHKRTHTKDKPYQCVICTRTFIQSVHLKHHMRTHTNIAPFECQVCGRKYKQSSHLNFHMKHHQDCPEPENEPLVLNEEAETVEVEIAEDYCNEIIALQGEDGEVSILIPEGKKYTIQDGEVVIEDNAE